MPLVMPLARPAVMGLFMGLFMELARTGLRAITLTAILSTLPSMSFAQPSSPKPIVIAHRGASAYLPEHSLLAVVAAHMQGADYIEQDVVLSRDGVPMVLHDIYLESTTDVAARFPGRARGDGRYYAIDFTLEELKSLSLNERREPSGEPVFPGRFPQTNLDLRVPTLDEEIRLIFGLNKSTGRTAGFYIELKAPVFHRDHGQDIAVAVLSVLDQYGLNQPDAPVFLQCFHDGTLRYLHDTLQTPLPLIQLIAENDWHEDGGVDYEWLRTAQGLDYIAQFARGIGPWIPQLFDANPTTPGALAARAHERGLLVHPYTLRADSLSLGAPDFETLQTRVLVEAAADGAFSDFPDLTRQFIDRHFTARALGHSAD